MVEKFPKFSAESLCLRQGMAECVQNMASEIMFPASKSIYSQNKENVLLYGLGEATTNVLKEICGLGTEMLVTGADDERTGGVRRTNFRFHELCGAELKMPRGGGGGNIMLVLLV